MIRRSNGLNFNKKKSMILVVAKSNFKIYPSQRINYIIIYIYFYGVYLYFFICIPGTCITTYRRVPIKWCMGVTGGTHTQNTRAPSRGAKIRGSQRNPRGSGEKKSVENPTNLTDPPLGVHIWTFIVSLL
jgi:hypothetical protein